MDSGCKSQDFFINRVSRGSPGSCPLRSEVPDQSVLHSVPLFLGSLSKAECSLVQQNYYSFDYYDEVLKDIGLIMDIDYGKRIRTLGEIKKILAKPKK